MILLEYVEVYSSYAYAVEPRAFVWEGTRHLVQDVSRSWKTPGHVHFNVRDEHQASFELIYNIADDRWFLKTRHETGPVDPPTR